jgi:hypothetical protein
VRVPSLLVLLLCGCGNPDTPAHMTYDFAMPPLDDMAIANDLAKLDSGTRDLRSLRIRRVFLTSQLFSASLGGTPGADAKCQSTADGVSLGGKWKAWLSDSFASPDTRFTHDGLFALVPGNPVADSWEQLTSGGLRHAIDLTETGAPNLDGGVEVPVWTDTSASGTLYDIRDDCGDWSDVFASQVTVGLSTSQGASWTAWTATNPCSISAALYCFEQ